MSSSSSSSSSSASFPSSHPLVAIGSDPRSAFAAFVASRPGAARRRASALRPRRSASPPPPSLPSLLRGHRAAAIVAGVRVRTAAWLSDEDDDQDQEQDASHHSDTHNSDNDESGVAQHQARRQCLVRRTHVPSTELFNLDGSEEDSDETLQLLLSLIYNKKDEDQADAAAAAAATEDDEVRIVGTVPARSTDPEPTLIIAPPPARRCLGLIDLTGDDDDDDDDDDSEDSEDAPFAPQLNTFLEHQLESERAELAILASAASEQEPMSLMMADMLNPELFMQIVPVSVLDCDMALAAAGLLPETVAYAGSPSSAELPDLPPISSYYYGCNEADVELAHDAWWNNTTGVVGESVKLNKYYPVGDAVRPLGNKVLLTCSLLLGLDQVNREERVPVSAQLGGGAILCVRVARADLQVVKRAQPRACIETVLKASARIQRYLTLVKGQSHPKSRRH